jgi:uncharacterized protein (TIGR02145 family)
VAGGMLKEDGVSHWNSPNKGFMNTLATNATGFTALPGGFRELFGDFHGISERGVWWTSTEGNLDDAWSFWLYSEYGSVIQGDSNKNCGYSVRCVKD